MLTDRKLITLSCLLIVFAILPASLAAQRPGENIYTQTGIISNLNGEPAGFQYVPLRVPELGRSCRVKVNFLKVETSAAVVDAYVNALDEQAKARGETPSPSKWGELRARLQEGDSQAHFEVLDA